MKKKMTTTLLACLLCGGMAQGQGQYSYTPAMSDITPPSPISRIFQKFSGFPVSHATGTVGVEVPLYTLQAGGISIPLTLKYHTSGVRVQDPVGVVGRNWALFPGFKISRTVMSKPDEVYPVKDKGSSPSVSDAVCLASPMTSDCDCRNSAGFTCEKMDGQYDIFRIHMAGLDASFILEYSGGNYMVRQLPDTPLKITPLFNSSAVTAQNRLYGFEVQDDRGYRYLFGESASFSSPSNKTFVEYNSNANSLCGWMLREIVLPGGGKVSFAYQYIDDQTPVFDKHYVVLDHGVNMPYPGCYWDQTGGVYNAQAPYERILGSAGYYHNDGTVSPSFSMTKSLVPVSITAPNVRVDFTYGQYMLEKMLVKNTAGSTVKTGTFTYTGSNRLLKKVDLSGEGHYLFTYKGESSYVPTGFDWWGYYNGSTATYSGLPSITLPVMESHEGSSWETTISIGEGANRTPSSSYMDTYALTQLRTPCGGTQEFVYEPNTAGDGRSSRIGGGLRIKSMCLYDPVSGKSTTHSYTYNTPVYPMTDYPDAENLMRTRNICALDAGTCYVRQRSFHTFPELPHVSGSMPPVWYRKVTETTDAWKKEYVYDFVTDKYNNLYEAELLHGSFNGAEYQLSELNSLKYPAPWLVSETSYRKNGSAYEKVSQSTRTYSAYSASYTGTVALPFQLPYNGISICQFLETRTECSSVHYYDIFGSPVQTFRYTLAGGGIRPSSIRRVDYHGTDSIVETTTLAYDETRKYNVTSKTVQKSDGTEETERYYYSNHTAPDKSTLTSAQQTAIGTLTANNRLTTVVQQERLKGSTKLYGVLNGFDSGSLLKQQYYRKGSGTMGSRMEYRVYDAYRNPIHAVKDGTEHTVYIWGYKGERLVAEIKGADYNTVKNALGCTPESLSSAISPNMTLIDGLRSKLSGATVTTYTHDPLVGPLTKRDANSNVTTYQYDSYGRLDQVKDHNGRQKEKYQYNFRP